MENLSLFKCKNCGGELELDNAQNGVIACEYCGAAWTVPKAETPPEAVKYLHDGNAALDVCKFDDAFTYFQKAAELDPEEPEAHFGMALAQFKVQYLKDEINDCLQPVCHEISEEAFTEDKNYKKALEFATAEQKRVYRRKGGEIDEIRAEFSALRKSGLDYDCFLCVKVTEEDGRTRTEDSDRANDIYYALRDEGYRPFYSEREMKGRTGSAYEALILYALYTSECMLIVCSDEDYLQTKWVKNEYTRFIRLMCDGGKERDALTFVFNGKPIERLPNGKKIQGIDFSKPQDAYLSIFEFVKRHTQEARRQREAEASEKKNADEMWRKQFEEQNRRAEQEREKSFAELKKKMEEASRGTRSSVGVKLTRAWQEMDARQFGQAANYFLSVLEEDPENEEAWRGRFLAEFGTTSESALIENLTINNVQSVIQSKNLKHFLQYKTSTAYDGSYQKLYDKIESILAEEEASAQKQIGKMNGNKLWWIFLRFIIILCVAPIAAFALYIVIAILVQIFGGNSAQTTDLYSHCFFVSLILAALIVLRRFSGKGKYNKADKKLAQDRVAACARLRAECKTQFHEYR